VLLGREVNYPTYGWLQRPLAKPTSGRNSAMHLLRIMDTVYTTERNCPPPRVARLTPAFGAREGWGLLATFSSTLRWAVLM
jgi:hypothetical protein